MIDDTRTGFIAIAAVRYAIGRATYAPSLVTGWVRTYWHHLSPGDQGVILRDVEEAIAQHERSLPSGDLEDDTDTLRSWSRSYLGHDQDRKTWYAFRDWIIQQREAHAPRPARPGHV